MFHYRLLSSHMLHRSAAVSVLPFISMVKQYPSGGIRPILFIQIRAVIALISIVLFKKLSRYFRVKSYALMFCAKHNCI